MLCPGQEPDEDLRIARDAQQLRSVDVSTMPAIVGAKTASQLTGRVLQKPQVTIGWSIQRPFLTIRPHPEARAGSALC